MADAEKRLEEVLTLNRRKMLKGFGSVSADDAEKHAKTQYKIFDKARRAEWKAKALEDLKAASKDIAGSVTRSASARPAKPTAGVAPKRKRVTAAAIRKWFHDNHTPAVQRSPYVDGEYVYPVVDVSEVLEGVFPEAGEQQIANLVEKIEEEGPWIPNSFLDALDDEAAGEEEPT